MLQKTSISFDDSVWEILEPLVSGARLVLARPGGQHDTAYLVRLMTAQGVTAACFVPSLLRTLLEEPGLEACTSLRRVTTGGERLTPDVQEQFFARLHADLYNGYGPTETTIAATFWTCRAGADVTTVPIGRPIANTQVYVLDDHLEPVAIGVAGELCIGGDGVARGYLNRPALTADRFVADPFRPAEGALLYRTGDRARYRPDGNLEYVGRLDDQIKLRGYRVEPGEVATVLEAHPAVRESAVVARDDGHEGQRLVAFIVPASGLPPTSAELRCFLEGRLPRFMVPAAFVALDALPLTSTGKLDRRALPIEPTGREQAAYVPPSTPVQRAIAAIWAELLGLDRVGLDDNFFDLGGHSLLATRMLACLRADVGVVSLGALFERPTVAGLAAALEEDPTLAPASDLTT